MRFLIAMEILLCSNIIDSNIQTQRKGQLHNLFIKQRSVSMAIRYLIICLNESIYISVYAIACDVANSSALLAANEC